MKSCTVVKQLTSWWPVLATGLWLMLATTNSSAATYHWEMVEDIKPGSASGMSPFSARTFGAYGGLLYFVADDGLSGQELYSYNGTDVDLVADINPGSNGSVPLEFIEYDNKLYFAAQTPGFQRHLFSFDGSNVIPKATYGSGPNGLTVFNGNLYYGVQGTAPNPNGGVGLHRFDGNSAQYLGNIGHGANYILTYTQVFKNNLYLSAFASGAGMELVRYDGNSLSLARDISPGSGNGAPKSFEIFNGDLYFGATTGGTTGSVLLKYDGTTFFTVSGFATSGGPSDLIVYNGDLYFQGYLPASGTELLKYDGSAIGVAANIEPGNANSVPTDFVQYNGELFFSAYTAATGRELYRYDGVSAKLVGDIFPGPTGSETGELFVFNNELYFIANDGVHGMELYKLAAVPEPAGMWALLPCAAFLIAGRARTGASPKK